MTSTLQNIVQKKLNDKLFTACAIGYQKLNEDTHVVIEGSDQHTYFDLASVTKVLFTTTAAADLYQQKKLFLDVPLSKHPGLDRVKHFIKFPQYGDATFEDLLLHRAGFPGTIQFADFHFSNQDKLEVESFSKKLVEFTTSIEPVYDLGEKVVYSDPGFIFLAELLAILSKKQTPMLWNDIQSRFGLVGSKDSSQLSKRDDLAKAGKDLRWGEPQDAQARHIGQLCGHAGLFGNISGLMSFGHMWLQAYTHGHSQLSQQAARRFVDPYFQPVWGGRYLGWDGVSENSTAGNISQKSIGHLGYTGTSLWIDLEKKLVVAILTNRTLTNLQKSTDLLTREQILEFNDFRRKIHNEIWRICSL